MNNLDGPSSMNEKTNLLGRPTSENDESRRRRKFRFPSKRIWVVALVAVTGLLFHVGTSRKQFFSAVPSSGSFGVDLAAVLRLDPDILNILFRIHQIRRRSSEKDESDVSWDPPPAKRRCGWVVSQFTDRDEGTSRDQLKLRYVAQSTDPNVFYRATAHIFWKDFVDGQWGTRLVQDLQKDATLLEGVPLTQKSTWTWVTGDQHLSNFGAWKNRHGEVVFSVNDFDEAALYDFQIDVLRIAVSITNHAESNGFDDEQVRVFLAAFTKAYVKTVVDYVDNQEAITFELTTDTAVGVLQEFLEKVEEKGSQESQLEKFTYKDPVTGLRSFIKGLVDEPLESTKLATVPLDIEAEIRDAFTAERFGATMMKMGWAVREWDDDFYSVIDVAERIGSGIGSFGVPRYYILLRGKDDLLSENVLDEGDHVILDVKYQPPGAVSFVLNPRDKAWYGVLFQNEAARVVEAQRRLTSYTDPYIGWVMLNDRVNKTNQLPFSVRQRSPWKFSMDLDRLTDPYDFEETIIQIAVATATSHVRGTRSVAPGDFKRVIKALLGKKRKYESWGKEIAMLALAYRKQVLDDFKCFQDFVQINFLNATAQPSF